MDIYIKYHYFLNQMALKANLIKSTFKLNL